MLAESLRRQAGRWGRLCSSRRPFWGWVNAVFNKVDYERIEAVGPDRAASEWLLRCGALVRYHGHANWQQDYNGLPTGPLGKYKIQAINATESCIMYKGFDYLDGLEHVEEIKLCKCIYIHDECLQRLSETPNLQQSLLRMWIISCGNVTDKGIVALHKLSSRITDFDKDMRRKTSACLTLTKDTGESTADRNVLSSWPAWLPCDGFFSFLPELHLSDAVKVGVLQELLTPQSLSGIHVEAPLNGETPAIRAHLHRTL